jgi:hypothetical protein
VRVDVALPFAAKVVCGGTKPQFMPDGAPEQTKVTGPANPPVELMATCKFAELPAAIVADVGEIEPVIPPTLTCTSWVWVIEPLAALTVNLSLPCANVGGVVTVSVT